MGTALFAIRRFGRLLLTAYIISTVVFLVLRVIPGDPAAVIAGIDASSEDVQRIRERLGTDMPIYKQYGQWLWDILHLRFGSLAALTSSNLDISRLCGAPLSSSGFCSDSSAM